MFQYTIAHLESNTLRIEEAETDFKYSHSARTYGLSSGMCVQCTGLQGSTGGVDACADCVDGTFADGLGNCPACPYQDKTCTSSTNAITWLVNYIMLRMDDY